MTNPELPVSTEVESIACLMINGIGDTICVTPALESIRQRYPNAEITFIVRPRLVAIMADNPNVDALILYDTKNGLLKRLSFFLTLFRKKFDLWIDLHVPTFNTTSSNSKDYLRNSIIMRSARPKYRVGYDVPGLSPYLTHRHPIPSDTQLKSSNIIDTTLALTCPPANAHYKKFVAVNDSDRDWLAQALPKSEAPRIILFFGSEQKADLWPITRIQEFLKSLSQQFPGSELIAIGSAYEHELSTSLNEFAATNKLSNFINFIEKATLSQTAALIESCDLFIGTDSGPLHIADALQVPIIALISSKNYVEIWQPITPSAVVLNHQVDCGPCLKADCDFNNKCMDMISSAQVLDEVKKLIS